VLATHGIFTFLGTWNAFLGPLIFLQRLESRTITVGIRMIQWQHSGIEKTPVVLAGSTISVLPILIIFLFGQRYFVQGIALSGIKG
jgi:multiple sugar transport system permease protein